MKKLLVVLMALGLCLGLTGTALAGDSATQTATYQVTAINELSVTGNPAALTVDSATAGSEPNEVEDTSTTYAITTNCGTDAKQITAQITTGDDMPANSALYITLAAPAGASSEGMKTLSSTSAEIVVSGIDAVASSGHMITYKLTVAAVAGVITSADKIVTLTITDT